MNRNAKRWEDHFKAVGLPEHLIASYMVYVNRMTMAKLPVIFEFTHLASILGRTQQYLASVINCTEAHYRQFEIPKRRGGKRLISSPYPALLECQQWIKDNILSCTRVHNSAHGFVHEKSIKTNAIQHLNKKALLKIDIEDFFPSINLGRVISVFQNLGYPNNVSVYLSRLCCLNGQLPQGAATSPALSNTILYNLDKRLSSLSKSWNICYTRYADDMTFSGQFHGGRLAETVAKICVDEGFRINREKTRFSGGAGKRIVTGISVGSSELKIPHLYKRELRQEIYYLKRYGPMSHMAKLKERNPFYVDSVLGKVRFWLWIEPNNRYAQNAVEYLQKLLQGSSLNEPD